MPRKTKKEEIEKLRENVEFYKGLMEEILKRNGQLSESHEEAFIISPSRFQLEDRLSFFKQLYELETNLYDSLKLQMYRRVQELTEKRLQKLAKAGTSQLFPDFSEGRLRDQVLELTSKVENRDETIEMLMAQIADYQNQNAALKAQMEAYRINQPEEYRDYIEKLSSASFALRKRYDELLISYSMVLNFFSDEQLKRFSEKDANLIRQKVNQILQRLPIPEQSEDRIKKVEYFDLEEKTKLMAEIERLEQEISLLSTAMPVKAGRPSTIGEKDIQRMRELREQNYSYRKIAVMMGCSVGTVHRLVSK